MRRRFTPTSAAVLLVLVAILAVGMVAPAAFAAGHRPVVTTVSPNTCTQDGGLTVTVTGQYFKFKGLKVVDSVKFGAKAATKVRVLSSTKLQCKAPAGTGGVYVRVTTFKGTSKRLPAAKFTYVGPATTMTLNAGTDQTVSAGTAVSVAPSVIVKDAHNRVVPGVAVTFSVEGGGGSVTGASATTDASGIAAVGSWKLGGAAGDNWLSATCAGITPTVAFYAKGDAGILTVQQAGTAVRSYNLAELQALTPFTGIAGYCKTTPSFVLTGPDAVTGVKVLDVLKDALGTPLAASQSVEVTNWVPAPGSPYTKIFTQNKLATLTGVALYNATTHVLVADNSTLTGPLAAVLVYSDPAGVAMPVAKGPLRFFFATAAAADNVVMFPASDSVGVVNQLNVIPTP
jgi:hypothetical protein